MDWNHGEIQSCYFRTASPQTFFWLDYDEKTTVLSWSFTFLDFGMHHTLSGSARVAQLSGDPPQYSVNGTVQPSKQAAMHAVFAGHYTDFMTQLRIDLGVTDTPQSGWA